MTTRLFFFGTLRDPALAAVVLGRRQGDPTLVPARLRGWRAERMVGEDFPLLVEDPSTEALGLLTNSVTADELDRVRFYEGPEYGLRRVIVQGPEGQADALICAATGRKGSTGEPWSFEAWARRERSGALSAAAEVMALYGEADDEGLDRVWPAIRNRARQRARAAEMARPNGGGLRTAFGESDAQIEVSTRPHVAYLSVEVLNLRHRRFGGGWSEPMGREVAIWGDAVTILPFDPIRDRVMLIEQFRPGPASRGDPVPWCIEVIAGRIDGEEGAEAVARREAVEEGGLEIGRIRRLPGAYPTPGLAAEYLDAFIGEADLPDGAGGRYGAEDEGEDIRAVVLGFDEAMAALDRGEVNTGPAQQALLWLSRLRDGLRRDWSDAAI